MAQLVCGGCHTLLMYIRGATSVQCSCCHTVNLAMEGIRPMKLQYHFSSQLEEVYSVALIPEKNPTSIYCAVWKTLATCQ